MTVTDEFPDPSRGTRRIAVVIVALIVLAAAGYGAYRWLFADDSTSTTTAQGTEVAARTGQLVSSLTTTGTAQSNQSTRLMFQAAGQVTTINATVGQNVKAGDELARLDPLDAQRKLESATANLTIAKLKLSQMVEPPKASDLASAAQAVASAQGQVANAQTALDNLLGGPTASDLASAENALLQAQNGLQNANNGITNAWTALLNAQRTYCQAANVLILPCYESDLPLSDSMIHDLTEWIRAPGGSAAQVGAATTAATSLLSANSSYVNSKSAVAPAQKSLEVAQAKLKALTDPPTANQLASAQASLAAAQANLAGAIAREATLKAGPTATDLALQNESVRLAQVSFDQAKDAMDNLVLLAPFDGSIGTISVNVGDQVGLATVAMTLTNPSSMRVDLTVAETDLSGLKAGQFGVATFDSMPGQTYLLKVTGVSLSPTVAQGVVTYPAQAQILTGKELAANAQELQKMSAALQSRGGGGQGGTGRTPTAVGATAVAQRTPAGNAPMPASGMSASVTILESVVENALLVPSAAVRRVGRQSTVTVVKEDGTREQRVVVTGGTDNTNTAIVSGLTEGEKVVVGGTTAVSTGTAGAAGGTAPRRPPTPVGGVR